MYVHSSSGKLPLGWSGAKQEIGFDEQGNPIFGPITEMTAEEIELKQKEQGESPLSSRGLWMTGFCENSMWCQMPFWKPCTSVEVWEDWKIYWYEIIDVSNLELRSEARYWYGWYLDDFWDLDEYGEDLPAWEHVAYGAHAFYYEEHEYENTLQAWFHMYGDGGVSGDIDYYGEIPWNCSIDMAVWHSER
jgi:hypothetical protein